MFLRFSCVSYSSPIFEALLYLGSQLEADARLDGECYSKVNS